MSMPLIAPSARFSEKLPFSAFFIALTVLPCMVRFTPTCSLAFGHIQIGGIFQQGIELMPLRF